MIIGGVLWCPATHVLQSRDMGCSDASGLDWGLAAGLQPIILHCEMMDGSLWVEGDLLVLPLQ